MILAAVHEVDAIWPYLATGMAEACARSGGDINAYWLHEICRKGDACLFYMVRDQSIKAGFVCRVENWSGKRVMRILAACGQDIEEWIGEAVDYREWFDRWGIQSLVFDGRPGWARKNRKARVIRHVYEVDLNGR